MHSLSATSVSSQAERVYGEMDYVYNPYRNKLKPSRADDLLFIYHNTWLMRNIKRDVAQDPKHLPWAWEHLNSDEESDQPEDDEQSQSEDDDDIIE